MRVSARRRSAASNTCVRRTTSARRRERSAGDAKRPSPLGPGSSPASRISPALSRAASLSPPWGPHGIPFTVRARLAPRRRRRASDAGAPVGRESVGVERVADRAQTRSSPRRSASAAAYSRGVSAGARARPALRPTRSSRCERCARPARRAARARRRRTAASDLGRADRDAAPAAPASRPNSSAWWRARLQPRAARASRRRRAEPTRSGRRPASRRRGSRSRPTRARRCSRTTNWPVSASRVPGTKPVTSRAGIPTLRASTTRLLAICSHQPSARAEQEVVDDVDAARRERRVQRVLDVRAEPRLDRADLVVGGRRRRGDLRARAPAPASVVDRRLRELRRAPRRAPAARRRARSVAAVGEHAAARDRVDRALAEPAVDGRRVPSARSLRRALSVSTATGLGAANTTSEKPRLDVEGLAHRLAGDRADVVGLGRDRDACRRRAASERRSADRDCVHAWPFHSSNVSPRQNSARDASTVNTTRSERRGPLRHVELVGRCAATTARSCRSPIAGSSPGHTWRPR